MRRFAFALITLVATAYFSSCGGGNPPAAIPSAAASLSVYALSYGSFTIGAASAAQTVTLTNNGGATLNISSIAPSPNFAETNTCGGSVAVGASCSISVTFTPTAVGDLTGSVTISDNALGGPQIISLTGTGKAGVTVAGVIFKSGVSGATVTVYAINSDGSNGAVLGTGTTDANGIFSVSLTPAPTGPVRVVASGGTYVSEWDGSTITSSSTVSATIDNASTGASGLVVTAVSTFVDFLTHGKLASSSTTIVAAHAAAEATIVGFYGFTPGSSVETLMPSLVKTDIASNPDAVKLGLILGTLAEEGKLLLSSDPDALIDALAVDISDGIWDGERSGTVITLGTGPLPSTAGTSDFLSDLAAFIKSSLATTTAGITISDASSLDDSVAASVSTCICTPTAVGLAATSSGAINSLAFGGKQYLFVAARAEGVVVIDITDPTLTAPTVNAWPQISSNTTGGFSGADVGGIIPFVGTAGHPQVLAFSYGSKHVVVLNAQTLVSGVPGTDNPVDAEMDVPLAATSPVGFSGGSAYIGSGVPLGGSLLFLATADGYMVFDASQVGPSGTPIVKLYPVDDTSEEIAENMGADILHRLMLGGNEDGGFQLIDLTAGATSGVSYYVTPSNFTTLFPNTLSTSVDGDAADSALQVGIMTFEDTSDAEFVNLATITKTVSTTTGVLNSWAPAAGGTAHVQLGSSGPTISGAAVDSTTHLVQFMAGYSTDFAVGQLQDPNSVPSGSWQGMSDWSFLNLNTYLTSYAEALDPHADGVVYNLLKKTTYGYVLDGSAHGVVETDLAGLLAIARAGTTGDAAHQPGTDPTTVTNTTTGGKVMQEVTW
ncbi:MAG TPA: choice-of-anchor D domain-containing protein [Terriglobia bacterium]|nr:choice-of-anchor D domain-containing protein [Terriglobia bacterium]